MQYDTFEITELFEEVQMKRIFPDGKTFVDSIPKSDTGDILKQYVKERSEREFNLKEFVLENFNLPLPHSSNYKSDHAKSVAENIDTLWDVLTRQTVKKEGTLISLPFPYIVPGGRFGEMYYWDSYFTMLGLNASGKYEMLENMVNNFSYLIDTFGYIPNGNREYFLSRSQPPFYSLMVKLLEKAKEDKILPVFLPQLEKEYQFWMKGSGDITEENSSVNRVTMMPDGEILNRYWDDRDEPRPESYREDVELSRNSKQKSRELFRHLRAAAESGWDFSCRWFKNKDSFDTIHTTDIIPVDLNCLLLHLEQTIGEACLQKGDTQKAATYHNLYTKRKLAIQQYCWDGDKGFYFDYDITEKQQKNIGTLAGVFPLFFEIATAEQASLIADIIKERFLKPGGVVTTLEETNQQWDAPNGWAPLQWITIVGLENYGFTKLAKEIATRWITLNKAVFIRTGKLMEKYNVINTELKAGGGEYEGQDGFGWTNGVFLALQKKYNLS